MQTKHEQWVQNEKKWMSDQKAKRLRTLAKKILPASVLGLAVFFALTGIFSRDAITTVLLSTLQGAGFGLLLGGLYLVWMVRGLKPARMAQGIAQMEQMRGIDEAEREILAREMLEAIGQPVSHEDFVLSGPNGVDSPASLFVTAHYVYMRGGYPLVNIVRLSDVVEAVPLDEQRTRGSGRSKRQMYRYTLYSVVFYYSAAPEGKKVRYPDALISFFSRRQRDDAYTMVRRRLH